MLNIIVKVVVVVVVAVVVLILIMIMIREILFVPQFLEFWQTWGAVENHPWIRNRSRGYSASYLLVDLRLIGAGGHFAG